MKININAAGNLQSDPKLQTQIVPSVPVVSHFWICKCPVSSLGYFPLSCCISKCYIFVQYDIACLMLQHCRRHHRTTVSDLCSHCNLCVLVDSARGTETAEYWAISFKSLTEKICTVIFDSPLTKWTLFPMLVTEQWQNKYSHGIRKKKKEKT